jgi:hypothetical protein
MARSEEQKKDLKFKLYVAVSLAIILIPILALGPMLPKIIRKYESTPTQPDSAKRMLLGIQIQASTMRADAAKKNLEKWITLFVEEDSRDWDAVMDGSGEFTMKKYEMGDGLLEQGFTPWLWPDTERPAPVASANDKLVAQALDLYGVLLEDAKEYPKAAHIYVCLSNMFAQDSEGQLAGEAGFKRCAIRSF